MLHHGGTSSICLLRNMPWWRHQKESTFPTRCLRSVTSGWRSCNWSWSTYWSCSRSTQTSRMELEGSTCPTLLFAVEDDIIYLDAEIAQAQAHLETLRTYRTSVFWCFLICCCSAELRHFFQICLLLVSEKKPALDQELFGWQKVCYWRPVEYSRSQEADVHWCPRFDTWSKETEGAEP